MASSEAGARAGRGLVAASSAAVSCCGPEEEEKEEASSLSLPPSPLGIGCHLSREEEKPRLSITNAPHFLQLAQRCAAADDFGAVVDHERTVVEVAFGEMIIALVVFAGKS